MFKTNRESGFTLIELVMVIVILGILSAVAVPKFQDLTEQAKNAATAGVIGGVRSGIGIWYASNLGAQFPSALDGASDGSVSAVNAFFDSVLAQGGITRRIMVEVWFVLCCAEWFNLCIHTLNRGAAPAVVTNSAI